MIEPRLPPQSTNVTLQTALMRSLDSVSAYQHAVDIAGSHLLEKLFRTSAAERSTQAGRIAALIERTGGTPDFGLSGEAGFQQIWMSLVNRRFPTFREGLPRECERVDRRLERVLARLWRAGEGERTRSGELGGVLQGVRHDLARLRRLRGPGKRAARSERIRTAP